MGSLGSLNAYAVQWIVRACRRRISRQSCVVFMTLPGTHRECRIQDKHTAAGYREQESEEGQAASIVAPAIGQAGLLILL